MIRQLRSGERVPEGEPRRYRAHSGYVRLRWPVAKGEYVEVYEHRVRDGIVVEEIVHHLDHDPNNNNPSNLAVMTQADHMRLHHGRSIPMEAQELYLQGWTPARLGKRYGLAGWTVTRYLRAAGVPMRGYHAPNRAEVDPAKVREMHAAGVRPESMARELGCSPGAVRRIMRELGLPSFPVGRPSIHENISVARSRGFLS